MSTTKDLINVLQSKESKRKLHQVNFRISEFDKNKLDEICGYYDLTVTEFLTLMIRNSHDGMNIDKEFQSL